MEIIGMGILLAIGFMLAPFVVTMFCLIIGFIVSLFNR
jgi:hypothetical protein